MRQASLRVGAALNPTPCVASEPADCPARPAKHVRLLPSPPTTWTQGTKSPPDSPRPWRIREKHAQPSGNVPRLNRFLLLAELNIPTGFALRPCSDRFGS